MKASPGAPIEVSLLLDPVGTAPGSAEADGTVTVTDGSFRAGGSVSVVDRAPHPMTTASTPMAITTTDTANRRRLARLTRPPNSSCSWKIH
jgi:hypothetical protein